MQNQCLAVIMAEIIFDKDMTHFLVLRMYIACIVSFGAGRILVLSWCFYCGAWLWSLTNCINIVQRLGLEFGQACSRNHGIMHPDLWPWYVHVLEFNIKFVSPNRVVNVGSNANFRMLMYFKDFIRFFDINISPPPESVMQSQIILLRPLCFIIGTTAWTKFFVYPMVHKPYTTFMKIWQRKNSEFGKLNFY